MPHLIGSTCSILTLFLSDNRETKIRQALAAVGKMALSNYVFQTIICTTLFYSYGFGLYNKTSPSQNIGIVLLIFLFQLLFSRWWMARFRFGPIEWLWRSLTYKKLQPIRIANYNDEH